MTDLPSNRTPEPTGISRRAIAKGAAWAVPAVLLAAPPPRSPPRCARTRASTDG